MIQFGTIKYGIQFRASHKEKDRARHHRGESSGSCSEEDASGAAAQPVSAEETAEAHMCPRCHEQFQRLPEFLHHKRLCDEKAMQMGEERMHSDPEDMVVSGDEEMDEPSGKRLELVRRHRQDAENNNGPDEADADAETEADAGDGESPPAGFPFPAPGHVALEALQNTKVAVAQFAAAAMANNGDNEAALQELAVLQSTLFTLQHQQVFQLQLIQQLQKQLSLTRRPGEQDGPATSPLQLASPPVAGPSPGAAAAAQRVASPKRRCPTRESTPVRHEPPPPPPAAQSIPSTHSQSLNARQDIISVPKPPTPTLQAMLPNHPPYSSISSSLASTIITNNDPPPSLNEPNTLEMLQKRAQEVLDNASQGLLANNLADELAFRKSGKMSPYDGKSGGRNEPFFKHRCRYCGKVFGSDSALQIHIRSHTGERPFKCNVCGSRFTTKGNLKVHFQRHTAKFPHVKMNPNPVPEHLDKYHPPLLAQLSPGPMPGMPGMPPHPMQFPPGGPPPFPPGLPLYRPPHHDLLGPRHLADKPLPPHPMFLMREEQELPADLSKPSSVSPLRKSAESKLKSEPQDEEMPFAESGRLSPKREPVDRDHAENEHDVERFPSPSQYDDCSTDSKFSNDDTMEGDSPHRGKQDPDQPENLSSKISSINEGPRVPATFTYPPNLSPPSSASSGISSFHPGLPGNFDSDQMSFNSLLPRPGSNDNSWESLVEITKTSETSKLQQMVDSIESKLSDPNQCVVCQRVLSCKSALQMHYRTHTGERPFRCRLCGRAFTTKGNLKTHMGVHRLRPPTRAAHQCPVCHRKFANALVLQQHVRLHTGEPTDLTPDQIRAAEITDFPPPPAPAVDHFLSRGFPIPGFPPPGYSDFRPPDRRSADDDSVRDENDDSDCERERKHRASPPAPGSMRSSESPASRRTPGGGGEAADARGCTPSPRPPRPPPTPPTPPSLLSNPLAQLTASMLGGAPFGPLALALGPAVRGNTTCNICYKTFACHSALEIHYRSHTKERPFKCTVCDRGFSTKSSGGVCQCRARAPRRTSRPQHATALNPWTPFAILGNMKQHMLTHKIRDAPHGFDRGASGDESRDDESSLPPPRATATPDRADAARQDVSLKRSPPACDRDLPMPKRPTTGPPAPPPPAPPHQTPPLSTKHLCGVCRKNFSSSSALQIHMRTHTGDKPFRCAVCQKAFTTKGNLKVHMGTHMWSSGASRRGRRMSLELPPRPPLEPHAAHDLLQRRPDLFYPYLPAPFLNGMQHKLNEISVIQQHAGQNNGLTSPGAKFPGLLGFGAFPPPLSQPESPSSATSPPPMHPSPRELAEREALVREFAERGRELAERDRDALVRDLAERGELAFRERDAHADAAMRELAERSRMLAENRDMMLREMSERARDAQARERDAAEKPLWELHYEREGARAAAADKPGGERASPPAALPLMANQSRSEGLTA